MPPDEQDPQWPSDDSDVSGGRGEEEKAQRRPATERQETFELPASPGTSEAPTVWAKAQPQKPSRPSQVQAETSRQQQPDSQSQAGPRREPSSQQSEPGSQSPKSPSQPSRIRQSQQSSPQGQQGQQGSQAQRNPQQSQQSTSQSPWSSPQAQQNRQAQQGPSQAQQGRQPQSGSPAPQSAQAQSAQPAQPWVQQRPGPQVQQARQGPHRQQAPSQPLGMPRQPPPERPVPPASMASARPMRIEPNGEMHVAAPGSPESPSPPEEAPRRKRRGLLVGGIVLLLVLALGGASAVPYVSNRLGLPWAPNLPKGDEPSPVTVNLALKAPNPSASAPTNSGVTSQLSGPAGSPALGQLSGIVIDPATGSTLWDHSSTTPLTPASATKLLTMSAALLTLDHGMQLSTKVVAGPAPGTVILVPGGDPTLSSLAPGQKSVYPGAAHLDDLVAQVKRSTGGSVKRVDIDPSLFSGDTGAPGWEAGDVPVYAAPIVSGMLDGGLVDPTNEGSRHVNDPSAALLQEFARRLGASAGGTTTAPKNAEVLGEVRSAPITEAISRLLQLSDNTLAEMIGRQTAIAAGAPATFAGVADTTKRVLTQNGFDLSGVQLNDGSGLSSQNKAPAKLLAQLLAVAAAPDGKDPRTPKLRALLDGLPVAGGSGTLAGRYNDPASSPGKGWVRAKTGTLSNVNTLAGYVLDADGRVLSFALMSNGSEQNAGRAALDVVAAALRGCGCR